MTVKATGSPRAEASGGRSLWVIVIVALSVVAVLGFMKLNLPFHNDQATFANYARMMDQGATLYEDVWDPKQPGIFYFFLAGGSLFGFSEAGFHLLELIYLAAGGFAGAIWLRRRLINGNVAFWYPILTAGWFYFLARRHDPGQVEILAGPLILGHLILSLPSTRAGKDQSSSAGRLIAAGLCVGLLGWLKLLLVAIPAVVAIVAALTMSRGSPRPVRSIFRFLGWQLVGVAIPLLGMVVWFAANGGLDTLWFTFVTYPLSIIGDKTDTVLHKLIFRSAVIYLPLLFLGVIALMRRRNYPTSRTLFLLASTAIAVSAAVVLVQTWWTYQATLALFPAALLAVFGLDQIVESPPKLRTPLTLLAILTLVPAVVVESPRMVEGLNHRFGYAGDTLDFQSALEPEYGRLADALERVDIAPGDTVYGTDNRAAWLADRPQAIPISPWLTARGTPDLNAQAMEQLRQSPADWVFVDNWAESLTSTEQLRGLLESDYRLVTETDHGEWWVPDQ